MLSRTNDFWQCQAEIVPVAGLSRNEVLPLMKLCVRDTGEGVVVVSRGGWRSCEALVGVDR